MKPTAAILSLVLSVSAYAVAQSDVTRPPTARVTLEREGATEAWWTDRQAGLVGGITGSVVGVLGGFVGTLVGIGKARRLAVGLTAGLIAFGLACLSVGVVAVAMSQPYAVYYPLLLIGFLCTLIFGVNFRMIRRSYAQRELRKMEALDVKEGCRP